MASSHIQKLSPQFRLKRKSYTWLAVVANNCSITLDFFGDNNYNSVVPPQQEPHGMMGPLFSAINRFVPS